MAGAEFLDGDALNAMQPTAFSAAVAPLFEGAPRFLARLAEARPFDSDDEMMRVARDTVLTMSEEEQVELLNAHPRIGADPETVSPLSHAEQGYDDAAPEGEAWVAVELEMLNELYESRFGFRFVIFVAGRQRRDILPILERALHVERDEELRRGLDDVIAIAADRLRGLRGTGTP